MFYDDDLGTENIFFPVCLISEYASFTINVYLYSIHLGIWNVTAVFQFPFKANKATGPDNIPAWVLRNYANVLAPPLTAIFNNSLREGVLPMEWKMANVIPLPKTSPPVSIEKNIRPISLTPIAAKVFESIIMKWVNETIEGEIDAKQFGGISGTSTIDVLVELVHMWYKATDKLNSYVMLDFSKAFDLIKHHLLLNKLQSRVGCPHIF